MTNASFRSGFRRRSLLFFAACAAVIVGLVVWFTRQRPLLSEDDPPDVIYRKITEAYGGPESFERWRSARLEYEVEFDFPETGKAQTRFRDTFQVPGKLRQETEFTFKGTVSRRVLVAAGDSGWVKDEDQPTQMTEGNPSKEARCPEAVRGFHPIYLLKQGRGILANGTARRADSGRDLILRIPSEDGEPAECRVDDRTGLIREYTGPIPVPVRRDPITVRYEFTDYKNTPGGPVPGRMIAYHQDRKVIDLRFVVIDLETPIEASAFNPPPDRP